MRKTTMLKSLILERNALVMPGCYDALSAIIIEKCGFKAAQVSGFAVAGSLLGKPDVGILSYAEMLNATRYICNAVDIPIMADGDTGFGNHVNTYYTVQGFEQAGAAGINIEDQVFPKRCGHMDGKQVIETSEMIKKIKAAVLARRDPDFVINARTDAIAAVGLEEAILRANAYAAAGADLIFIEAPQKQEDIKYALSKIKAPVSINMTDGGKTPMLEIKMLRELGVARVSMPVAPVFAAAKAMLDILGTIMKEDAPISLHHADKLTTFSEFTDLVGLPFIKSLEKGDIL